MPATVPQTSATGTDASPSLRSTAQLTHKSSANGGTSKLLSWNSSPVAEATAGAAAPCSADAARCALDALQSLQCGGCFLVSTNSRTSITVATFVAKNSFWWRRRFGYERLFRLVRWLPVGRRPQVCMRWRCCRASNQVLPASKSISMLGRQVQPQTTVRPRQMDIVRPPETHTLIEYICLSHIHSSRSDCTS